MKNEKVFRLILLSVSQASCLLRGDEKTAQEFSNKIGETFTPDEQKAFDKFVDDEGKAIIDEIMK